jgi:enamine deaminase RidA (YjgF/YER057c/UK114 family)
MDIAKKLSDMGWVLPESPKPVGAYVPAVLAGPLLFVSGQLPMLDGKLIAMGKVPSPVDLLTAQKGAARCAANALAIVRTELNGDWDRLVRVLRIGVFVQCKDNFTDQAKVANGASELQQAVMDEAGRHVRAAVGVNALPMNAAVEAEFLFQVR